MNPINLKPEELLELIIDPNQVNKEFMIDGGFNKIFNNICIESSLEIKDKNYNNYIIFTNTSFDKIQIENTGFQKQLWFKECTFNDNFIIYSGCFDLFQFTNCKFNKGLYIYMMLNVKR